MPREAASFMMDQTLRNTRKSCQKFRCIAQRSFGRSNMRSVLAVVSGEMQGGSGRWLDLGPDIARTGRIRNSVLNDL